MSISTVSDIFNRPPAISDDMLQYALYPRVGLSDRASVTALAALMRSYVDSLLPGHLWHRDSFELKVAKDEDQEGWILKGRMRVGDCVDDEWCAVWLLREISAKWDVVISVLDFDGEFLLIEAAEALPSWVTPTNAENRVWIYQSQLHLLPLSHVSASSSKPHRSRYPHNRDSDDDNEITHSNDSEDYISIPDALRVVRDPMVDTLAPSAVGQLIWKRISGYPATARQHVHVTKAYLPIDIAKALGVDPTLIQKPVETFYTRDALQLRTAHKMSRFPPEPSVLTTVKMTRTAYAQLAGQKFYPPKVFGRWQEQEGTKEWRWHDVGMKIACGFEMTYQESKGRANASRLSAEAKESSAAARQETLRRNPECVHYMQNLVTSGYFRGELEGSQLWSILEDKAVDAFLDAQREDDASRPSFATFMNSALSLVGTVSLPPPGDEDPDDWLNVDAEALDSMLERNFDSKENLSDAMDIDKTFAESAEDSTTKFQADRLHEFAKKVEEFVEAEGDAQGALFADEHLSDEGSGTDDDSQMAEGSGHGSPTEARDGANAVDQARRQADMALLVPPLDPSDFGRMPAYYYTNSQRVAPTPMETEVRDGTPYQTAAPSGSAPLQRHIRPPIIPRDRYDGVDSDDETDEEGGEDEEEEDNPQVVGDVEIDMEEEEEEFLEFARQALGVSDEQWGHIVRERRDRGAYVPSQVVSESRIKTFAPEKSTQDANGAAKNVLQNDQPTSSPRPVAHLSLDSFEAVMQAMDAELSRMRPSRDSATLQSQFVDKGKGKAKALEEQEVDIEAAMDAELREALELERDDDDGREDAGGQLDYNLIRNFLESFKSQSGLSGPVGSLAGRLQPGWTLPRDES